MTRAIRDVEKSLGTVTYELSERIQKSRELSRSLFVVKDVEAGETLTENHVKSIRPGFGMHPKYLNEVIGKKAKKRIVRGTPLDRELLE
jgi:pseudaminic acid synthase